MCRFCVLCIGVETLIVLPKRYLILCVYIYIYLLYIYTDHIIKTV